MSDLRQLIKKTYSNHFKIYASVLAGVLTWVVDSVIDSFIFHENLFLSELLTSNTHEIYMRVVWTGLVAVSVYTGIVISELRTSQQSLSKEKETAQMYLDIVAVIMVALRPDGTVSLVNKMGCNILGYETSEIIGKNWFDTFIPAEIKEDIRKYFQDIVSGRSKPSEYYENPVLTKAGKEKLIAWRSMVVRDEKSSIVSVLSSGEDITERNKIEEELRERVQLAQFQAAIGTALAGSEELRDLLQKCAQLLVSTLNGAFARIWTLNSNEQVLELQASAGLYTHLDGPHGRVPVGKFKIGLIAQERKPHLTNQVVGDPRVGDQEWAKREGMVAFAGYPLLLEDRVVGVMAIFARHTLTERHLQAMGTVANSIALAIERKQAEQSIEKLRLRNESILNSTGEGIMGLDTEGMQTFVNPAAARMLGYSEEELIGRRSHELWHHSKPDGSPHPAEECPIYAAFKDGTVHHQAEDVFWKKDGSSFPVEYISTPIIEHGNVVGAVVAFSDITKTIALRDKLEKLTITDALTGFYNRRGFLAFAEPKLKLSLRSMDKILLIYADMDNLKAINDRYGHLEGDRALSAIADILKGTFRETDILARLGGDEFAVLAIDTCDEKVIEGRIQKNMDSYNNRANSVYRLSMSIGIVCFDPEKPCPLDDLLTTADALMYDNKLAKKRLRGREDLKF